MESTQIEATNEGSLTSRVSLVTEIPGPKSRALLERRNAAVSDSVSAALQIFIERAHGGVIEDVDGNVLIDFAGGIGVSNVGNSHPAVVRGVKRQVEDFTHVCFAITPYEEYVEVCELLNQHTPGDHAKKSALWNSGAEAVENAVKVARSYTGRSAVVVFRNAFHGRTNLTMAMTAKNMPYKDGFGPFASDVYRVPMANPFGFPGTPEECADQTLTEVRTIIDKEIGASNVACIIVEPIQGEGGFIVPAPGFLQGIREYCTANGIVFIADEVQSGFGRTGKFFGIEHEDVIPDLITTAKALGGGLPLAAVTGRAEMMDSVHLGGLGTTFGGNPVSCVGAIGAFEAIDSGGLIERAAQMETVFRNHLERIRDQHPVIGDIRGRGAMIAIELRDPKTGEPDADRTVRVQQACHRLGLLAVTTGTFANVIRFLPPLVAETDLLEEGLRILARAFDETS